MTPLLGLGPAALLLALLLAGPSSPGEASTPPGAPHPLHLTTTHLALDEEAAFLRIRLFKEDLEAALAAANGLETLSLQPSIAHDRMFLEYFSAGFELGFDGLLARPVITASGEDLSTTDGEERIWWVELQAPLPRGASQMELRVRLLYERFDDQRNIVRILRTGDGRQRTIYFAAPDDDRVTFDLR